MTKAMADGLKDYLNALRLEELNEKTIKKYDRDIRFFLLKNQNNERIEKTDVMRYKNDLLTHYKMSTVNSYIISVNRYLCWLGHKELAAKTLRLQKRQSLDNILTVSEYRRLLSYLVENSKWRDYLLLRTIGGTGIRVGELKYITCEAAANGSAEVYSKGKGRVIVFTEELSRLLLSYCVYRGITAGVIFTGRTPGKALEPKSVWKLLKTIADKTGVNGNRVYPHALRHLFARTYMQKVGNVLELADILGHSSVETTRIYAVSSRDEKRKSLGLLGL